jgi:lipoprotein-releasing system ATP-binding protein
MTTLKLANISKYFWQGKHKINALQDANLSIKNGQCAAIVGPSGSGKTTFLQIAGLLDAPSEGEIFINGINASSANETTKTHLRRNHIGFIYQSHHLLPEFSALENVAMPLLIQNIDKKTAHQKATEILAEIGLQERLHHLPSQLSGGQQQRVAVARAMVHRPQLLLADEPTGNLDSINANIVFDLILKLARQCQTACLIITHNLDLAKKLDKIYLIKDGILEEK